MLLCISRLHLISRRSRDVGPVLSVSDQDAGATWSYSLMAGNNSERFSVDAFTGVMTFAEPQKITITIQDINDNAPAFTLPYYIVDVDQYAKRGSLIGSLTVTDSDKGTNAEFSKNTWCANPPASYQPQLASPYVPMGMRRNSCVLNIKGQ
ncbi:hypothetical protein ScPMuIL_008724 [Solemya velum]